MKNKIRDYISEIEEDTDNEDFNDDEDPLSDVRDNRRGTLLSARNITIALIALTIVFFGGYFAAFALATRSTCRPRRNCQYAVRALNRAARKLPL